MSIMAWDISDTMCHSLIVIEYSFISLILLYDIIFYTLIPESFIDYHNISGKNAVTLYHVTNTPFNLLVPILNVKFRVDVLIVIREKRRRVQVPIQIRMTFSIV